MPEEPKRLDSLTLLHPVCRALVGELIIRCTEVQIPLMIIETWRSRERQLWLLEKGASRTPVSDHEHTEGGEHTPTEAGYFITNKVAASLACDLAPYEVFNLHGPDKLEWDADAEEWQTFGRIAEDVGLRWGGRWRMRDMGHVYAEL